MNVKFVKLYEDSHIPTKAHPSDAGMDCYCHIEHENLALMPHQTVGVSLGFKMEMPEGYCALLFPRSGMGKININLGNCVGVVDAKERV